MFAGNDEKLPCSPWNVISKFLHQSLTENPFVAFID